MRLAALTDISPVPVAYLTTTDAVKIADRILGDRTQADGSVIFTSNGDPIAVVPDNEIIHNKKPGSIPTVDARVMVLQSLIDSAKAELRRLDPNHIVRRRVDTRLSMLLAVVEYRD